MAEERIGKITKISDEKTVNDKPYKKIAFECEGRGQMYSLFLPSLIKLAKENDGKWVKLNGEENEDGYWNVKSIEATEAPEGASPNGDRMSREDWDAKDRRIVRQSCIKAAANIISASGAPMWTDLAEEAIEIAKTFEAYVYGEDMPPEKPKKPAKAKDQPEKEATRTQRLNAQAVRLWTIDNSTKEGAAGVKAFGEWFQKEANGIAWDDLTDEAQENIIKALKKKADNEGEAVASESPF